LIARFLINSIKEETISEYKLFGDSLIKELIVFAKEFFDDDELNVFDRLKTILSIPSN
jgi:hypothetical protein